MNTTNEGIKYMTANHMIRIFTYKIYKLNILSHKDIRKMRYGMQVVYNELIKFIVLIAIFLIVGKFNLFLFSVVVLLSIRSYSGGIHLNSNIKCFTFSLVFFLLTVIILPRYDTLNSIYASVLCLIIIGLFSPIPSNFRPIKSKKRKQIFKFLSIFFTAFWLIILYNFVDNPIYFSCGLWTIYLQSIQLLYERMIKNEV